MQTIDATLQTIMPGAIPGLTCWNNHHLFPKHWRDIEAQIFELVLHDIKKQAEQEIERRKLNVDYWSKGWELARRCSEGYFEGAAVVPKVICYCIAEACGYYMSAYGPLEHEGVIKIISVPISSKGVRKWWQ